MIVDLITLHTQKRSAFHDALTSLAFAFLHGSHVNLFCRLNTQTQKHRRAVRGMVIN